jgi:hypothetical protein
MLRRMVCGTLLCAMAALAGACGSTITAPTITGAPVTETFTGTLNPASTTIHSFVTLTGGPVTATLTAVGPDPAQTVGFSLGTFNPTLNVCTVVFDNSAALQGAVFTATASTTGFYCARMYDNGSVAAAVAASADGSVTSFSYTVTVVHPQ